MALDAPIQLGSYLIEALIGAGGMGEVYRARDLRLQRLVAIKILIHTPDTDFSIEMRRSGDPTEAIKGVARKLSE
jgi:serine/threonine-protein kinase